MTAMRLKRYPSPSGGIALGKMGVGATMLGSILPAGARWVEYLESTGTQYIDTDVIISLSSAMNMSVSFTRTSTGVEDAQQNGFVKGSDSGNFRIIIGQDSNRLNLYAAGWAWGLPADTGRHEFSIDYVSRKAIYDSNIRKITGTLNGYFTQPFYLFARNNMGVAELFCDERIYETRFYNEGNLIRDFRPIAIGTTGYMLDLVSGEYLPYGNKGTGDFVIGPDINAPAI